VRLLVLGGQLQGTEITYLAKAAGWEVTVVDLDQYQTSGVAGKSTTKVAVSD